MRFDLPFDLPGPRPVIAGTGLIALDVVIPNGPNSLPQMWAGGTCGNVLAILALLGWDAYPIARLRDDAASRQITHDLNRWGVKPDFLGLDPSGSTPVIVQHIHCTPGRGATHSFSRKCPSAARACPGTSPSGCPTRPKSSRKCPRWPSSSSTAHRRVPSISPGRLRTMGRS